MPKKSQPAHPTEEEALSIFRRVLELEYPTRLNLAGTKDDTALIDTGVVGDVLRDARRRRCYSRDALLILTQDGMIEGVHFRLAYMSPSQAVVRCALANLSDVSAMGGVPIGALVNLGVPKILATNKTFLDLSEGLKRCAKKYKFEVLGGDLIGASSLTICITMIGAVGRKSVLRRSGAKVGDVIYISAPLGRARVGLRLLEAHGKQALSSSFRKDGRGWKTAIKKFLTPEPRLELGRSLATQGIATSCIDLSDSLSKSLLILAEDSGVGFDLSLSRKSLHRDVLRYLGAERDEEILMTILSAEEDFELLFTADPSRLNRLPKDWGRRIISIGRVVDKKQGVHATLGSAKVRVTLSGFRHF